MGIYSEIILLAVTPVFFSALFYYISTKINIAKFSRNFWQIIIGVFFGILACLGTIYGVDVGGALANVRDASILCAGLIFGGEAGIIAGVIGGVFRYVAVWYGLAGDFTQIACSLACILAGIIAYLIRKFLLDNKIPGFLMGLFVGIIVEAIHLSIMFFTNVDQLQKVVEILKILTVPMFVCNGLAVSLALLVVSLISKKKFNLFNKKEIHISELIQSWLMVVVVLAFLLTCIMSYSRQNRVSENDIKQLLTTNIDDVKGEIVEASNRNLIELTKNISYQVISQKNLSNSYLKYLAGIYNISEINIIDSDLHISYSTNDDFVGFDMESGEQSKEFMDLFNDSNVVIQEYQPITINSDVWRKYAGAILDRGCYLQIGYDAKQFQQDIGNSVINAAYNRHIGKSGYITIVDAENYIISGSLMYSGKNLSEVGWSVKDDIVEMEVLDVKAYDKEAFCMYSTTEGYKIIAVYPADEALFNRNMVMYVNTFAEIILFAVLFAAIYILIKKIVVDNIQKINLKLAEITGGNLDVTVEVMNNQEFASLSDDINSTVSTLKRYIKEAENRINKELEYAKDIQHSALPPLDSVALNRKEFDIFASMYTAKEVGGDFYDFYYIDNDHLAITIADVSGKGIPAAMFMMSSKTMLKSIAEAGFPVDEVATRANDKLSSNNEANMFVTVWMGILELSTGHIEFINAGHNFPALKRKNGEYEFLKSRPGLVMAGMEGLKYKKQEAWLKEGDIIVLYTDGVTEATDSNNELYGDDRLIDNLNSHCANEESVENILKMLKEDVDGFVKDAPQFDDITMLCLKYNGKEN